MVTGLPKTAVRIVSEIHPSFYDIVPSVVKVVGRRFKGFVEESDLRQECYLFAAAKHNQFKDLLDDGQYCLWERYDETTLKKSMELWLKWLD